MTTVPQKYEVELYQGGYINLAKPDPASITVVEIAHRLANINRFGGASRYPYSVAQHAVFVARRLKGMGQSVGMQYLGLHHDDAEAFLGDWQKPMKMLMGKTKYDDLTKTFERAIGVALGVPGFGNDPGGHIKQADTYAVLVEAKNLLKSKGEGWRDAAAQKQWRLAGGTLPVYLRTPSYWRGELHWQQAFTEYLTLHNDLKGALSS